MVRIIDPSVAIKWFVHEPGRESALSILQELLDSPEKFAVPELFFFELIHVFHRVLPKPSQKHIELFEQLFDIGLPRFAMTIELNRQIRRLQKRGLSGYDAAYVALAKQLKGRWLTFDHKAHARIASLRLSELL